MSWVSSRMDRTAKHRGMDYSRVVVTKRLIAEGKESGLGPLEVAFADAWERENQPRPGINYGRGILQDLMYRPPATAMGAPSVRREITMEDAELVATAIQWLGTSYGFSFLAEVFREAGYDVVRVDETGEARRRDARDD